MPTARLSGFAMCATWCTPRGKHAWCVVVSVPSRAHAWYAEAERLLGFGIVLHRLLGAGRNESGAYWVLDDEDA